MKTYLFNLTNRVMDKITLREMLSNSFMYLCFFELGSHNYYGALYDFIISVILNIYFEIKHGNNNNP